MPLDLEYKLIRLLKRLWLHINSRRRKQFIVLMVLMVISSISEVISIGMVVPFLSVLTSPEIVFEHPAAAFFIDKLNITKPNQLLLPVTIIFSIAALISGAIRLFMLWFQTRLSHAIGADLSINIYRNTLYQPYSIHMSRNSSEIISAISVKADEVVYNAIIPVLIILSSSLVMVSILGVLIMIDAAVAIGIFVGFGSIYIIVIYFSRLRLKKNSQVISDNSNKVIKILQEGLGGIRDILIDNTQEVYCNEYKGADLPLRRAKANVDIIGSSPRFLIETLCIVFIAIVAFFLTQRNGGILQVIPILGALALGAQRLLPILQYSYAGFTAMRGRQATLKDALDLLDRPIPSYLKNLPKKSILFKKSIELKNISFRYNSELPDVLSDFNIVIEKGHKIGFIGTTGSGKSTLLDIIMGLIRTKNGLISVDNQIITDKNYKSWQMCIAHVPQNIFLADSSVSENIAFGVPKENIDFDLVRSAAKQANIAHTIESWNNKYDTDVGEHGVFLSGGQRQRIGIARALYKRAEILILDEGTSALDEVTEKNVMEAIENLDKNITIIIVAHRLSTLKNCNKIIELSEGKVKKTGLYSDFMGNENK